MGCRPTGLCFLSCEGLVPPPPISPFNSVPAFGPSAAIAGYYRQSEILTLVLFDLLIILTFYGEPLSGNRQ